MATIPHDIDLWPGLAAKLATRRTAPLVEEPSRWRSRRRPGSWGGRQTPANPAPHPAEARQIGGFLSAAAIVGLIALAFGMFAMVQFPPPKENTPPANLVASPLASPVPGRECNIEEEITAESTSGTRQLGDPTLFEINVWASLDCEDASGFFFQLSDAAGKPLPIEGNPAIVPFSEDDDLRFIAAMVTWSNWCGPDDLSYLVEDGYVVDAGIESEHSELVESTPGCHDDNAPSKLEVSRSESWRKPLISPQRECEPSEDPRGKKDQTRDRSQKTSDPAMCDRWEIVEGQG